MKNEDNKLCRDEVWIEAWLAAMNRDFSGDQSFDIADRVLAEYDKRFGEPT